MEVHLVIGKINFKFLISTFLMLIFISCSSTNPSKKVDIYDGLRNENGKYHGQGVLTYANGNQYVGDFQNGMFHGKGTMTYPNGTKYIGNYAYGKKHGQGTMIFVNGELYIGNYKNDLKHGYGAHFESNGTSYYGEHSENLRFGIGASFDADGGVKSGFWNEDKYGDYSNYLLLETSTVESVERHLINTYPRFKGFDYDLPEIIINKKPNERIVVSVVDFAGYNVSNTLCKVLTDRLRYEFIKADFFKVVEREMMEEIMGEQGFQQSGCTTDECMVEVGKIIGVKTIIGGSISKVGRTYTISARIIDIETSVVIANEIYDYKGDIDTFLVKGVKQVARKLINSTISSP